MSCCLGCPGSRCYTVDQQSRAATCGQRHETPDAEEDIQTLMKSYADRKIHDCIKGRKISNEDDFAADLYLEGSQKLGTAVWKWAQRREIVRNKDEDENDLDDDSR